MQKAETFEHVRQKEGDPVKRDPVREDSLRADWSERDPDGGYRAKEDPDRGDEAKGDPLRDDTHIVNRWTIRPARETDLDRIAFLESETFSDPWSRKAYQDILGQERYCILVLTVSESICGYLCGMSVLDEGELHRIVVSPSQRGQGYGQRLLETFFERLKERGVGSVYLEVRAGNAPAIGLYRKTGFDSVGIRKAYYQNPREDALIMQKTLSSVSI